MKTANIKISLGYILICLLWGSTWITVKIGLESLTPFLAAGLRFSLASLFIYIIMRIKGITIQTDSLSIKLYIIMGLFAFVVPFGIVYWAQQFIQSGLASILFGAFPFFVLIFTRFAIPSEKIDFLKIIAVVIGFTGIFIIFSNNISVNLNKDFLGMLAIVFSASLQASVAVIIKKYGMHLNSLSMNLVPLMIGGTVLVLVSFFAENLSKVVFDTKAILSVGYLAFFGTVLTFTTYYWLLKRINIVILSLSSFITPIIAIFLGWLILSEKFSTRETIGSSLVLIGVLFANLKGLMSYYFVKNDRKLI